MLDVGQCNDAYSTIRITVALSVLDVLVKNFNIMPISTPDADLKAILG